MEIILIITLAALVAAFSYWIYLRNEIQSLKRQNRRFNLCWNQETENRKSWAKKAHKYKNELLKCEKELNKYKYRPRDENGRFIKAS